MLILWTSNGKKNKNKKVMHLFHCCPHHSSSLTVNISPLLFVYLAWFKRGLGFVTTRFDKVCVHSRALWGCTVNLRDLLMNEVITNPPSGAADPKVHPKQSDIYPLGDGVNVSKYTSRTPNRGRNCLADWGDCVLSLKRKKSGKPGTSWWAAAPLV